MTDAFVQFRNRMVREQIEARGVKDPRVLEAMREVPREEFLPGGRSAGPDVAYRDGAQPVGRGQTLSQPYMVGFMTEALELPERDARVLEIGTGTGYQAAVLAKIANEVWTVERDPVLAEDADRHLTALGFTNVRFHVGDGTEGWAEGAPYDGILVTAGAPDIPQPLLDQLAIGGRLVIPVGPRSTQRLERILKKENGELSAPDMLVECRFVPLVGRRGWQKGDSDSPEA